MVGRIGVAPSDDIYAVIGNDQDMFSLIQLCEQFPIQFGPTEPEGVGYGLGFMPFFVNVGEGATALPDFLTIKQAISDTFNNTCQISMKQKFTTWKAAVAQGGWERTDPHFFWPMYGAHNERVEEEGMFNNTL